MREMEMKAAEVSKSIKLVSESKDANKMSKLLEDVSKILPWFEIDRKLLKDFIGLFESFESDGITDSVLIFMQGVLKCACNFKKKEIARIYKSPDLWVYQHLFSVAFSKIAGEKQALEDFVNFVLKSNEKCILFVYHTLKGEFGLPNSIKDAVEKIDLEETKLNQHGKKIFEFLNNVKKEKTAGKVAELIRLFREVNEIYSYAGYPELKQFDNDLVSLAGEFKEAGEVKAETEKLSDSIKEAMKRFTSKEISGSVKNPAVVRPKCLLIMIEEIYPRKGE